jgi:hypothetical protein
LDAVVCEARNVESVVVSDAASDVVAVVCVADGALNLSCLRVVLAVVGKGTAYFEVLSARAKALLVKVLLRHGQALLDAVSMGIVAAKEANCDLLLLSRLPPRYWVVAAEHLVKRKMELLAYPIAIVNDLTAAAATGVPEATAVFAAGAELYKRRRNK